jgi:hypothetical protein
MLSATDGWAVGQGGTILHWDGSGWSAVSNLTQATLYAVDAFSSTDAWAAGAGVILHWDGMAWSEIEYSSSYLTFHAIAAISATDVWAAGYAHWWNYSTGWVCQYDILYWDGVTWAVQYSSGIVVSNCPTKFLDIEMVSANEGWTLTSAAQIFHWDGNQWTSSQLLAPTLHALDFVATNDGWAVGDDGRIVHWDGSQWADVTSPTTHNLFAVSMVSAVDGWALGDETLLHWTSAAWTPAPYPSTRWSFDDLTFIAAADGWVAGSLWGCLALEWKHVGSNPHP